MKDFFFTINEMYESLFKDRGSKFIGICYQVTSEEEVKKRLDEVKNKYHDARHHCYAYILNFDASHTRANDDGEPGHSAGDPILGQIRSKDLTNTLVIVVRYFGGTKLGVSGLINAYKTAAATVLDKAKIIKRIVQNKYTLTYGYEITNEVMKLIADLELEVISQDFTDICKAKVGVRLNTVDVFLKQTERINTLKVEAEK